MPPSIELHRIDGEEEALPPKQVSKHTRAPILSAIVNLANTTIGAGVLSLPYVMAECGLILGVLLIIACGIAAAITLKLLVFAASASQAASKTPKSEISYESVGRAAYGRLGHIMATISIILLNFGACCAFLILAGDQIFPMVVAYGSNILSNSRAVWICGTVFVFVLPLCMLRQVTSLRHTSLFAVIGVIIFAITAAVKSGGSSVNLVLWQTSGMLRSLPIVVFSFACQTGLLPIYAEMPTEKEDVQPVKKMSIVVISSISLSLIVYLVVAISGYATFGSSTHGDVLLNYGTSIWMNVVRIMLYFVVVFSYPIAHYPLRKSLYEVASLLRAKEWTPLSSTTTPAHIHYTITIAIVSITTLIAILVPDVVVVFGITGATACTMTTFVMPTLFSMKLYDGGRGLYVIATLVFLVGVSGGVAATIALLLEMV